MNKPSIAPPPYQIHSGQDALCEVFGVQCMDKCSEDSSKPINAQCLPWVKGLICFSHS